MARASFEARKAGNFILSLETMADPDDPVIAGSSPSFQAGTSCATRFQQLGIEEMEAIQGVKLSLVPPIKTRFPTFFPSFDFGRGLFNCKAEGFEGVKESGMFSWNRNCMVEVDTFKDSNDYT